MRAQSVLWVTSFVALTRTAHADMVADVARAKLEAECGAFKKDYEASRAPSLLGNLGLCGLRLERDGDAIDAYARYLHEDPNLTGAEHARVVEDLQQLEVSVGHLTLEANQPQVMVSDERTAPDGSTVTNQYGPIDGKLYLRVRPGHHILTTTLAGFQESSWAVDVFSSTHDNHAFTMRPIELVVSPPPRPGRGARYGPWMLTGLGGAMVIAGSVTGAFALDRANHIENADDRTSAKTFAAVTDVLLIGGALAVAGGLTWLVLERRSDHATAMCSPAGCSVRVEF